MKSRPSRFARGETRRIRVSFEFFPPSQRGDGQDPVGVDRAARAAGAEFRLGHLWRRRLDTRAHPRDGETHSRRNRADAGRASHLRRRDARRNRRHRAQLRRRRRATYRGAARRSGRRRRAQICAASGRLQNAADLVAGIKRIGDFEISVSAYPEKHPDSATVAADIDMLKAKVDAGASRAITQFFFENDLYFRYLERVRARGIDIPIVPGILPVQNSRRRRISPRAPAPRCRPGWPSAFTASTTIRPRAS